MTDAPLKKPTKAQARKLIQQVDRLALVQTNVFIRELLRSLGKTPGANKEEFKASLEEAIGEGLLTEDGLATWLRSVEGWGNQHIYTFEVPEATAQDETWASEQKVEGVTESAFKGSWRAAISQPFPKEPKLTRIDFDPGQRLFLVEWHERSDAWVREKDADIRQTEGGDPFWYKAFRQEPSRALMRFALVLEPQLAKRPLAALFLRVPVRTKEHTMALDIAWRDLDKLVFGGSSLRVMETMPWDISRLVKRLDQQIQDDKRHNFSSKATKFADGQSTVEFVAPPDMELPPTIKTARLSITGFMRRPTFLGSSGDFWMNAHPQRPMSRDAHVTMFQPDNRIKILTELEEADVWTILETFDTVR